MAQSARDEAERLVATVLAVAARTGVVRDPDPRLAERLAIGAGELATGVAGMLRALSTMAGSPLPSPPDSAEDSPWSSATRESNRAAEAAAEAAREARRAARIAQEAARRAQEKAEEARRAASATGRPFDVWAAATEPIQRAAAEPIPRSGAGGEGEGIQPGISAGTRAPRTPDVVEFDFDRRLAGTDNVDHDDAGPAAGADD